MGIWGEILKQRLKGNYLPLLPQEGGNQEILLAWFSLNSTIVLLMLNFFSLHPMRGRFS